MKSDDWSDWTDEALLEYEICLYQQEVEGVDTWEVRDEVLWEIARRGACQKSRTSSDKDTPLSSGLEVCKNT